MCSSAAGYLRGRQPGCAGRGLSIGELFRTVAADRRVRLRREQDPAGGRSVAARGGDP